MIGGVRETACDNTHMENTENRNVQEKSTWWTRWRGKLTLTLLVGMLALQGVQMHNSAVYQKNVDIQLAQADARVKAAEEQQRSAERQLADSKLQLEATQKVLIETQNQLDSLQARKPMTSRGDGRMFEIECTAYEGGGHTATGQDLNYITREEAMCVAVDPDFIPLGSYIRIVFDEPWEHLNGVYLASDTGGAVEGNIVDIYFGHDGYDEAMAFGRRTAYAEIL